MATTSVTLGHCGGLRHSAVQLCMLPSRSCRAGLCRPPMQPLLQTSQHQPPAISSTLRATVQTRLLTPAPEEPPPRVGEAAIKALARAARAATRYGWLSCAIQLFLALASTVVLLFSVAFTPQTGNTTTLNLTIIGVIANFVSCFWNFGYTRIAKRLQRYLSVLRAGVTPTKRVRKQDVLNVVINGVMINLLGFGSALLGMMSMVGALVAQTIANATSSPYVPSAMDSSYNPILVLDVFLVQAVTNTLLGHFLSLVCSLWLLNIVGEGRGLRFQRFIGIKRLKRRIENNFVLSKGNALVFRIDSGNQGGGSQRGGPRDSSSSSRSSSGRSSSRSGRGGSSSGSINGGSSTSTARPVVGAATATAVVGFSAAAKQMQAADAQRSALGGAPGPSSSVAREMLQSISRSGGVGGNTAARRPLLFPTTRSLQYLDGSLPGDQGFDPLGLFDPAAGGTGVLSQEYLRYSEVIHSRWAMFGAMCCLLPDAMTNWHLLPEESRRASWLLTALPSAPLPVLATAATLIGALELRRWWDFTDPDGKAAAGSETLETLLEIEEELGLTSKATGDPAYPGGPVFNALQLVRDSSPSLFGFKEVELVNGRLAMLALVGFTVQAAVTGQGPYTALVDHLQDPFLHNIVFEVPWPQPRPGWAGEALLRR